MNVEEANRLLISSLSDRCEEREAASICSLVMERITGLSKSDRWLQKESLLSDQQKTQFERYRQDLIHNRPVQYVLEEAWFGNFPLYVDEHVLIPRPETEELTAWIIEDSVSRPAGTTVLDIGTGSGCIPVYIKSKRKDFQVTALDISGEALKIARRNSAARQTDIDFLLADIRDPSQWQNMAPVDLIVSNPPYIPEKQREFLDAHVKDFEPSLALFVPDDDPIQFYKIIGAFACQKLKPSGVLFLEIHHDFAKDTADWYTKNDFSLELKKDFSGNNRMIKAWRP